MNNFLNQNNHYTVMIVEFATNIVFIKALEYFEDD